MKLLTFGACICNAVSVHSFSSWSRLTSCMLQLMSASTSQSDVKSASWSAAIRSAKFEWFCRRTTYISEGRLSCDFSRLTRPLNVESCECSWNSSIVTRLSFPDDLLEPLNYAFSLFADCFWLAGSDRLLARLVCSLTELTISFRPP